MLLQFFRRRQIDADLSEEIRIHIDARVEELRANGMPLQTAQETARREFGNVTLLEERAREVWRWTLIESLLRDICFGARRLLQAPGFTAVCVLTLALGLGANLALFSLVQTILLKPLPFPNSDRLLMLYEAERGQDKRTFNSVPTGTFTDWQRNSHGFAQMAIWNSNTANLSGHEGQVSEKLEIRLCSWNLFRTLGVQPVYGRLFSPSDDKPGAAATTVLTWGLFQRRFGGDPGIIGQTILLDERPYTVIGVLPSWFTYPDRKGQLWTPAFHDMPAEWRESHYIHAWNVVARLRNGISPVAAVAEVDTIQARIHRQYSANGPSAPHAGCQPLLDDMVGEFKTPLYVLLAAVICLLWITCLNVASLLLARSMARRKEIAVRSALGGSGWRIVQEQLVESLLLAMSGGVASAGIAYGLIRWIVSTRPDLPRTESLHVDGPLLVFGICLILLTGILSGFLPAWSSRRGSLLSVLQDSSRSVKSSRSSAFLRKYLVATEVALTAILLLSSGLLLKSFLALQSVPLGCTTKNILTMGLILPESQYKDPARTARFLDALLAKVRALPDVHSAGVISTLPGTGYDGDTMFTIPEHPPLPKNKFQFAIFRGVDPDLFQTLHIPVLRGRVFTAHDRKPGIHRVIINATFARQSFPREDPIGKHLQAGWDDGLSSGLMNFEIIGVVGDTRYRLTDPAKPMMYLPIYSGFEEFSLVIRSAGDPLNLALPVQNIVQSIDPNLGVSDVLTFDQAIGETVSSQSFEAVVVGAFAGLSLLLASIGLYGVLSYLVTQRRSEIGIRIALGAQRGKLIRSTLFDGIKPALFGLCFGVAGGIAGSRLLQSILFGTSPIDTTVFVIVPAAMLLVAVLACTVPAVRASGVDPLITLRAD